jgi:hypothetical protein
MIRSNPVAQKHITLLIDDLTGKELAEGVGETVEFSLDGIRYEIDVDAKTAERLRSVLAPYVGAGRRLTPSGRAVRRTRATADPAAVRAWAASNGIPVSNRGRVPGSVLEQYRAAGN